MSTQTPQDYREGNWEIRGQQVIATHAQGQWILHPMEIEYIQAMRDPSGASAELWIKARSMASPYPVGRYAEGTWNFMAALSAYAARNGIPMYHNVSTAAALQGYPQQASNQGGYAQQTVMQGAYPQQAPAQGGYPQQPVMQGAYPQQAPAQGGYPQSYQQPAPPRQPAYPPPHPVQVPPHRKGGSSKTGFFFFGLALVFLALILAGSAARGAALPMIIIGVVVLVAASRSGTRASGGVRRSGSYDPNDHNTWQDEYGHASGSFIDRDHDGIDDRFDPMVDSDHDGIPDSMDGDFDSNDGDSGGGSDD